MERRERDIHRSAAGSRDLGIRATAADSLSSAPLYIRRVYCCIICISIEGWREESRRGCYWLLLSERVSAHTEPTVSRDKDNENAISGGGASQPANLH